MAASINPISASATMAPRGAAQPTAVFSLTAGAGRDTLVWIIGLSSLLTFAYWEVLYATSLEWAQPQYSHGWIIPVIALFILAARRPVRDPKAGAGVDMHQYLRPVLGVAGGIAAVGFSMGSSLPDGVGSMMAGIGLAAFCLASLAFALWGQPFARWSNEEDDVDRTPLWIITAVGGIVVVAGLLAFVGVRLPGLHPGYYQVLGLFGMLLAGLGYAVLSEETSKAGLAELVFGGVLTVLSLVSWAYAVQVDMLPLARVSFVTALFGVFALVGGVRLLKWAGPPVGFLLFMFPLPTFVENSVLSFFQKIAVRGGEAVFTLIGASVIRRGNQLEVEGIPMEVVEACSGLSMSTILIAMAIAMVMLINRPWWDKLIVLISAIPIALIANIFRIVATGLLWIVMDNVVQMDESQTGPFREMLHNYAGIVLMMPFALGLYWLEFKVLSMLTVEEEGLETQGAGVLGRGGTPLPQ